MQAPSKDNAANVKPTNPYQSCRQLLFDLVYPVIELVSTAKYTCIHASHDEGSSPALIFCNKLLLPLQLFGLESIGTWSDCESTIEGEQAKHTAVVKARGKKGAVPFGHSQGFGLLTIQGLK